MNKKMIAVAAITLVSALSAQANSQGTCPRDATVREKAPAKAAPQQAAAAEPEKKEGLRRLKWEAL